MNDDFAALKIENDLLREENILLKRELGMDASERQVTLCCERLGVTRSMACMLLRMHRRDMCSKDSLRQSYEHISGPWMSARRDESVADNKTVDVQMCKMRQRVAGRGIIIETIWGQGYRLTPDSKRCLTALLEEERAVA